MRNTAVVRSINADLVVCSKCIPRTRETLPANVFTIGAGGKGLNQAIACYRLAINRGTDDYNQTEVDVQRHAAIGEDIFGDMVLEEIDQDGFSTEHIEAREMESTGQSGHQPARLKGLEMLRNAMYVDNRQENQVNGRTKSIPAEAVQ